MTSFKTLTLACSLAASAALLSAVPAPAASLLGLSVGKLKATPVSPAAPAFSTRCLGQFIRPYLAEATLLQTGGLIIISLTSQTLTQGLTQLVLTDSLAGPLSTATGYFANLQTYGTFGVTALTTKLNGVHLTNLQATLTYLGSDRATTCVESISGSFLPIP